MAKQKGILPIEGTIGNITFYKSGDGYLVREKGGVSAKRIAGDPRFQRTRENNAEFGQAGMAGKQLRTAFRPLLQNVADRRMISRLAKAMMAVVKSDTTNPRGQRLPQQGNLALLNGFDFNAGSNLGTALFAPFSTALNTATGVYTITVEGFIPEAMIAAPAGATHFKLVAGAAQVNFSASTSEVSTQSTGEMLIDATPLPVQLLTCTLPAGGADPVFLLLGIEFYQMVNGLPYSLKNGAFNALRIVAVTG